MRRNSKVSASVANKISIKIGRVQVDLPMPDQETYRLAFMACAGATMALAGVVVAASLQNRN